MQSTEMTLPWLAALLASTLAAAAADGYLAAAVAGRKFCLRLYLLNLVFFCISLSFKAWFAVDLQGGMYAYYLVFMLAWHVCLMRFGLCVRGMECLWRALLFTGLMLLSEGFAALFATLFTATFHISLQQIVWLPLEGWSPPAPLALLLNGAVTTLTLFLMGLAVNALRRVWKRGGAQPRVALIVLREVMLIFSLIAIYAYMSGQAIIAQDGSAEGFVQYLTEYSAIVLLCMPLLCVIASYIIQDVRYLHQRRLNRLYEYQQEAYEAALGSQQRFRHNIVNMLYGLEGAINSEDTEEIRRYYEQLLEKCALANNDNVLALRRVTQPALNGLLLRVLDKARGMSLPLQLDVEEGLGPCRHINAVDLCQIVGVLADNALEAAERAEVRYVGISLSALEDGGMELLVRNTYAGEVTMEQLRREKADAQAGHGHGLPSCYAILRRHRHVFLNFRVTGQYVEAQLLL